MSRARQVRVQRPFCPKFPCRAIFHWLFVRNRRIEVGLGGAIVTTKGNDGNSEQEVIK